MANVITLKPRSRIIKQPPNAFVGGNNFLINIASVADSITSWGTNVYARDQQLRQFWPTEEFIASAVYDVTTKYSSFGWSLEGPPKTVKQVQNIFHNMEGGKGWRTFSIKLIIDLLSQDNGGFAEIVRTSNDANAPVLTLNHLDAGRCTRTGIRETPVIYQDINGALHVLNWYDVLTFEEFPSPIEQMHNVQLCALSRILRAAQIMKDLGIYDGEKVGGRFTRAIHLVGGVNRRNIDDALLQHATMANAQGLTRYVQPLVVSALDPNARVSKETLELASLPDGFDREVYLKWYITKLAMAFGTDYQDFAPMPAGNLGTSQQSQILHQKSRGKGAAGFMSMMAATLNFHGIVPNTVVFKYGETDDAESMQLAQLRKLRAETRAVQIASGEIDAIMARQIAVDDGDLDENLLAIIGEHNTTPDSIAVSTVPAAS